MTRMILRGMITSISLELKMMERDVVRRGATDMGGTRVVVRRNNNIRRGETPGIQDSTTPTTSPTLAKPDIEEMKTRTTVAAVITAEQTLLDPASMPRSRLNSERRLAKVCIPGDEGRAMIRMQGDRQHWRMGGIKVKDHRECSSIRTSTIRSGSNRHHLYPLEAGATRRATRKRPAGMDIRTAARLQSAHRSPRSLTRIGQDRVNIRRAS